MLLVKIVKDGTTEFHWLPLTEFNVELFNGHDWNGTYVIRTSLKASPGTTEVVHSEIPEAIRKQNLKPVAVPAKTNITVPCGETFTLDASESSDPEGQPLIYWWKLREGRARPDFQEGKICEVTAPDSPQTLKYTLCVVDGLRLSEPVDITVHVVEKK